MVAIQPGEGDGLQSVTLQCDGETLRSAWIVGELLECELFGVLKSHWEERKGRRETGFCEIEAEVADDVFGSLVTFDATRRADDNLQRVELGRCGTAESAREFPQDSLLMLARKFWRELDVHRRGDAPTDVFTDEVGVNRVA
jgi:hypothetical protein